MLSFGEVRQDFFLDGRETRLAADESLVSRDEDGRPRVEYLPVTITRWPPGERIYGR